MIDIVRALWMHKMYDEAIALAQALKERRFDDVAAIVLATAKFDSPSRLAQ